MDTFSVVMNLADFSPEPRLGGPVWSMPVQGRDVNADTSIGDHFDDYPVHLFGKSKTLVRYKTELQVGRAHVRLEVWAEALPEVDSTYGWQEQWWCRVEANAGRLVDPDGWAGCRLDIAAEVMSALVVHLGQLGIVTRACPHMSFAEYYNDPTSIQLDRTATRDGHDEPLARLLLSPELLFGQAVCLRWSCLNDQSCGLKLNRLDLCYDVHGVRDFGLWRAVVAGTRQVRLAKKDERFQNYISATSGVRGVRFVFYDKCSAAVEMNAPLTARPPQGTVRLEAQLHKDWLRNGGIRNPSDVSAHGTQLFMKSYRWVGLDRAVGGTRRTMPQSRWMGRRPIKLRNWWQWLEDRAAGLLDTSSRTTVNDNEALARRGGYVVGVPPASDLGPARRLDLHNGVEAAVTSVWAARNNFTPWSLTTVVRRPVRMAPAGGS